MNTSPELDFDGELRSLREIYVASPPSARYQIILKRIDAVESDPVKLCTMVSAVEALARSILVHRLVQQSTSMDAAYAKYRNAKPGEMVKEALETLGFEDQSSEHWLTTSKMFALAVDFRNLIVHECTYLGQDKTPQLIGAAHDVLFALAEAAGLLRKD